MERLGGLTTKWSDRWTTQHFKLWSLLLLLQRRVEPGECWTPLAEQPLYDRAEIVLSEELVDDQAPKKACDCDQGPCRRQFRRMRGRYRIGFLSHGVAAQLLWGDGGSSPAANTLNRDSLLHHQTELRLHFTCLCSSICCKSPFKKLCRLAGFLKYQHSSRAQALRCQHQASVPRRHHFDTRNLSSHQGSSAGQPAGANKMCSREICKKKNLNNWRSLD